MDFYGVNLAAVLIAAAGAMIVGMVWYSPLLFGKLWMEACGMSEADAAEARKKGMGGAYPLAFANAFVISLGLAYFLTRTNTMDMSRGLLRAFIIWAAFLAPVSFSAILWEGRPFKLHVINASQYLVSLLLMAVIQILMS